MIRIERAAEAPPVLKKGKAAVAAMHAARQADPYGAGTAGSPFSFNPRIYGHETVKAALLEAQHGKCAYCEGHFQAFGWGDVEHYRPKGFSQQSARGSQHRPGYYWLAYEWSNLLASCSKCNQQRKKNLFPLRVPGDRARTPEALANEQPIVLDPAGGEDPRMHIGFEKNVPVGRTDVGEATIGALALDREHLNGLRLHHLARVIKLQQIIAIAQVCDHPALAALAAEAAADLEALMAPEAPFSAMTLCAVEAP